VDLLVNTEKLYIQGNTPPAGLKPISTIGVICVSHHASQLVVAPEHNTDAESSITPSEGTAPKKRSPKKQTGGTPAKQTSPRTLGE
jgi:hypothetical protein